MGKGYRRTKTKLCPRIFERNAPPTSLSSILKPRPSGRPAHNLTGTRWPLHCHLLLRVPQLGGQAPGRRRSRVHFATGVVQSPSPEEAVATVPGHPIPAPRGIPTLQHLLLGRLAQRGSRRAASSAPTGGHAPPRPLPVRGSLLRTPILHRALPPPPCPGITTESSLPQSGNTGYRSPSLLTEHIGADQ